MPDHRLYLFDIDGTLLLTGGVGIRAMEQAGQDLFGPSFSAAGIDFAGRLDPLLLDEMLTRNSVAVNRDNHRRFRSRYAERLPELLSTTGQARALPGVHDLVSSLHRRNASEVGLLTGNFQETGVMKLTACGLDASVFSPAVWGDQSPHDQPSRDHLPAVAMDRYRHQRARHLDPARVVVIGDTPHDVRCASVNGCRSLAVATGKYSVDELKAAGATAALPDLSDTDRVVDLLASL
jgi:phosphoglycolate phosphatase-like HAD superfamily hydrolase